MVAVRKKGKWVNKEQIAMWYCRNCWMSGQIVNDSTHSKEIRYKLILKYLSKCCANPDIHIHEVNKE